MDDKLFIGARSSLLVSNGALALYAVLAVLSAVFHVTSLCAVLVFLLHRILRPIHVLCGTIQTAESGDLSVRVPVSRPDEFGMIGNQSTFFWRALNSSFTKTMKPASSKTN